MLQRACIPVHSAFVLSRYKGFTSHVSTTGTKQMSFLYFQQLFVLIDLEGKVNTVCIGKQSMALGKKNKPQCVSNQAEVSEKLACSTSDSLNGPHRNIFEHNKFFFLSYFKSVFLSAYIYFNMDLIQCWQLGRMCLSSGESQRWRLKLLCSQELRETLSNSSVRKEVTVV